MMRIICDDDTVETRIVIILQKNGVDLPCHVPCRNHSRRDQRRSSRMRFQKQAEDWYPSPQTRSPYGLLDSHFGNVLVVLLVVDLYNPYISPAKKRKQKYSY